MMPSRFWIRALALGLLCVATPAAWVVAVADQGAGEGPKSLTPEEVRGLQETCF